MAVCKPLPAKASTWAWTCPIPSKRSTELVITTGNMARGRGLTATSQFSPQWTMELFTNWSGTVDAFAGYDNVLYFNIGNEVIFDLGRLRIP